MSYIVKIAENDNAVLKIIQDDDASNPRTDWDNFGHMTCFHSRYSLGDSHNYSEPRDFLEDLAYGLYHENRVDNFIDGKAEDYFRDFSVGQDEDGDWIVIGEDGEHYDRHYYDTEKEADEALEIIVQDWKNNWIEYDAENDDLMELIQEHYLVLPLYLYDHSGITINTTGFSCPWDSGQVGWIYVTNDEIIKEYGTLDLERARKLLISEVETYDQYIRGDVYGYSLEKKVECECCNSVEYEHVDSCWGFYGMEYLEQELSSYLPSEFSELVGELDWAG